MPQSIGQAGLRARVTTKLQLKKTAAGKIDTAAAAQQPHSILFANPTPRAQKKAPEGVLKQALAATVDEFSGKETGGVRPQAAAQFGELVHLLRGITKEELLLFNKQIGAGTVHEKKDVARAVFLDALLRTATSESVEAIATLLGNKQALDRRERRMAFVSLHLVEEVERDALQSIGVSPHNAQTLGWMFLNVPPLLITHRP